MYDPRCNDGAYEDNRNQDDAQPPATFVHIIKHYSDDEEVEVTGYVPRNGQALKRNVSMRWDESKI